MDHLHTHTPGRVSNSPLCIIMDLKSVLYIIKVDMMKLLAFHVVQLIAAPLSSL